MGEGQLTVFEGNGQLSGCSGEGQLMGCGGIGHRGHRASGVCCRCNASDAPGNTVGMLVRCLNHVLAFSATHGATLTPDP